MFLRVVPACEWTGFLFHLPKKLFPSKIIMLGIDLLTSSITVNPTDFGTSIDIIDMYGTVRCFHIMVSRMYE